jgi:hypothetical protein
MTSNFNLETVLEIQDAWLEGDGGMRMEGICNLERYKAAAGARGVL